VRAHNPGLVYDLVAEVANKDNWRGKISKEKVLSIHGGCIVTIIDRRKAGPELCDEDEAVEVEPYPGADNTRLAAEWKLIKRVSLHPPGFAEADVREADGAPGEDGGKSGKGEHPVESLYGDVRVRGEEAKETESRGDDDGNEGTSVTVDVTEDFGSLTLVGEGSEGTRGTVDGGVTNGEYCYHDDDVEDGGEARDPGILDGDDERGSSGICTTGAVDESWFGIWDQEADQSQGDDVKESNAPEDLFDGSWE